MCAHIHSHTCTQTHTCTHISSYMCTQNTACIYTLHLCTCLSPCPQGRHKWTPWLEVLGQLLGTGTQTLSSKACILIKRTKPPSPCSVGWGGAGDSPPGNQMLTTPLRFQKLREAARDRGPGQQAPPAPFPGLHPATSTPSGPLQAHLESRFFCGADSAHKGLGNQGFMRCGE